MQFKRTLQMHTCSRSRNYMAQLMSGDGGLTCSKTTPEGHPALHCKLVAALRGGWGLVGILTMLQCEMDRQAAVSESR